MGIRSANWTALGLLLPGLAAAEAPAATPTPDLLGVALNLLMVIGLILALAWGLRRYQTGNGGAPGAIRIVSALPLGARDRMVLVEVGGEQILVGVSNGRMERLHVLKDPVEVGPLPAGDGGFASRLRDAVRGTGR